MSLATAFHAEHSRAVHAGESLSIERLGYMTEKAPHDHVFPLLLGLTLAEQDDYVGALGALRQARDRVLLGLESRPRDLLLTAELEKLAIDIADTERRL